MSLYFGLQNVLVNSFTDLLHKLSLCLIIIKPRVLQTSGIGQSLNRCQLLSWGLKVLVTVWSRSQYLFLSFHGDCHALTLDISAFLYILVRSGCDQGGYSSFCKSRVVVCLGVFVCLCWLDMVPNQRQLFIIVSDWGSYLGSHFPNLCCGILSMYSCLSAHQQLHVQFGCLLFCSVSFSFLKYVELYARCALVSSLRRS